MDVDWSRSPFGSTVRSSTTVKGCIVAVHFDCVVDRTLATSYVAEDEGVTTYPDDDVWETVKQQFRGQFGRICVARNPNGTVDVSSAYVEMKHGGVQSHIPAGSMIVRIWRCVMEGEEPNSGTLLGDLVA